MRRRPNKRIVAALALLLISVSTSVSTFIAYESSQDALRSARESLNHGRTLRKLTDLHFCRAINESREINNRDRATFKTQKRETKRALKQIKDPLLRGLLRRGLKQIDRELRARPHLKLLECVKVIQHPTGKLPKQDTTTTR